MNCRENTLDCTDDPNRGNKKKDKGAGKVLNSSEAAKKIVNAE